MAKAAKLGVPHPEEASRKFWEVCGGGDEPLTASSAAEALAHAGGEGFDFKVRVLELLANIRTVPGAYILPTLVRRRLHAGLYQRW